MSAPMASVCIRCGSKEHSTREHDEQKAGGKSGGAADKPKRPASSKPAAEKVAAKVTRVQHAKCWDHCLRPSGIPDVIDKPLPERFYRDPAQESWFHRTACPCVDCEKRALRKRTEQMRRLGKA
jgi:hypothetical protein